MKRKTLSKIAATALALAIVITPGIGSAQQAEPVESSSGGGNGPFIFPSILLSILKFPQTLVTCVATQVTGAVAYTATYRVEGSYDGGTNGRDIGETARRSCTAWFVTPSQMRQDYGR
jgi:hypothetical protein